MQAEIALEKTKTMELNLHKQDNFIFDYPHPKSYKGYFFQRYFHSEFAILSYSSTLFLFD